MNKKLSTVCLTSNICFCFSSHPYIFFNQDGVSLTFVGFKVSEAGHLLNSTRSRILKHNIMTAELRNWFKTNGADFDDDYSQWTTQDMISKLCTVMGTERHRRSESSKRFQYVDDSYVLTVDNVTKILAIQMRFRY